MTVLLISGSVGMPSHTRTLTEEVGRAISATGFDAVHWNLRRSPLPIADPRFHADPTEHQEDTVREFVDLAESAEAFVLASPVYHNSYSGVLKNALDHLAIPQFAFKSVGLLGHGGHRTTQAVDHLRIVARGLGAVTIPSQVCTSEEDYRILETGEYELRSREIGRRVGRFVVELVAFTQLMGALGGGAPDPGLDSIERGT